MRKINALLKPHSQRLPLQSVNHKLEEQHTQRERQYKQLYFGRNWKSAEDHIAPGGIVNTQDQSDFQSDAPEYDAVVEKASTEHAALVN